MVGATTETDRERWLAERRTGIGGSDAAAVLGVNPWKSALEVWAEKVGLMDPPDLSENEAVEFGTKLEGVVLETLAERTGRHIERWPQTRIVRHPEKSWLLCTPDAFEHDPDKGRGIVQAKTTSAYRLRDWQGDEPPLHYQVQIQHEMAATGCEWGTLCCLVGGQRFLWFDVRRNDRFVEAMLKREAHFWRLVETQTPPEPDGSPGADKVLGKLYADESGESVTLPPEALEWDTELAEIRKQLSALQERKRALEQKLKAAIGHASVGVLPDGTIWTYKTVHRREHVVKATTYRQLRRVTK